MKEPVFARADMKDERLVVLLSPELIIKVRDLAEMIDKSQSSYVRGLIIDDLRRRGLMDELSTNQQVTDTQEHAQIINNPMKALAEMLRPYL